MSEESNEREGRGMMLKGENRETSHTTSPPAFVHRQRTGSSECQPTLKKNYHEKNIEHLKVIKEKQLIKKCELEEEKKKLDLTRERLARIILKRSENIKRAKEEAISEQLKKQEEEKKEEENTKEEIEAENENIKKTNVSAYYRSRYASLLKTIQESNKLKAQQKEIEQQKKEKFKQKLKEELGLVNVTSKLFVPGSNLPSSNSITENEIAEAKGQKIVPAQVKKTNKKNPEIKPPEEDKEKQKIGRDAAEKIKKRAQDHLVQLADKKEQEIIRELEAKKKTEKLKASLREIVLNRAKNLEATNEEIKEEPAEFSDSSDSPAIKKPKKTDESALRRLSQAPRRWNAPLITDVAIFRKKYKLSEKDKIFIVIGGYPDIKHALLKRSIIYLGRLV